MSVVENFTLLQKKIPIFINLVSLLEFFPLLNTLPFTLGVIIKKRLRVSHYFFSNPVKYELLERSAGMKSIFFLECHCMISITISKQCFLILMDFYALIFQKKVLWIVACLWCNIFLQKYSIVQNKQQPYAC